MLSDRRSALRVPAEIYLTQYVDEEPYRCFTVNLSASGLYVNKLVHGIWRRTSVVQLEMPVPGGDTIWARGNVMYDGFDTFFHSMGIRLDAMARKHQRMLDEYVHDLWSRREIPIDWAD